MLPTGYSKSLVFQVLPYLLKERDAAKSSSNAQVVGPSVVVVVSPLNALMYEQISKLRGKGAQAAILSVTERVDEDGDSFLASQWDGTRATIIEAGYEIVFCHPRHFFLVRRDWKFYKAVSISELSKRLLWTKVVASLNGENFFCNGVKMFLA